MRYTVRLKRNPTRYIILRGKVQVRFITKQSSFGRKADALIVAYWLQKG